MSTLQLSGSMTFLPDLQSLQSKLYQTNQQMEQLAKEGKYVLAENFRMNAQQIKKEIDSKRIKEVQRRQKKENRDVKCQLNDDLAIFNKDWDQHIRIYQQQCKQMMAEMKAKHKQQQENQKQKLEQQMPLKGKQSSQFLNLRKIEQNLAKQQNYVQAHLVQKQLKEMQKKEQQDWEKVRAEKIDKEMALIRARQQAEQKVLQKKSASGAWELSLERTKAEAQLVLKHSAVTRQLKSQNKKQTLVTRGQMKSKVDVLSPGKSMLSPSKSRILSSTSRSKLNPCMTR